MSARSFEETSRRPVTAGAVPSAEAAARGGAGDVRRRGFPDRAPVERALAWVDAHAAPLGAEELAVGDAVGRIPAAPAAARREVPGAPVAGEDGFATRAAETAGATAWSPAALRLAAPGAPLAPGAGLAPGARLAPGAPVGPGTPLGPGAAAPVVAGDPLPAGADAIVPFGLAQEVGAIVEVIGPVAEGSGIARPGDVARAGLVPLDGSRPLRAHDAALLAAAGVERVRAVRRPVVRLAVLGPKGPGEADAHGPMLRALVARDGGVVEEVPPGGGIREVVRRAAAPGADAILVSGRTGVGPDDEAPLALAELGEVALHGLALRPGGSAALGLVTSPPSAIPAAAAVPALLLPGDPLACLCAYELLGGRLVRRLAGRDPALPHRVREAEVGRKLVSAVGSLDVCLVRLAAGRVEPLGTWEFGGLGAAARADGFVLVPAELEGHPPGARVAVHLFR